MPFGSGRNKIPGPAGLALLAFFPAAVWLKPATAPGYPSPPAGQDVTSAFIGASACAACHADIHRKWTGARHSRMLQVASADSVAGDFSRDAVTLRGTRFTLERGRDGFAIRGPFPSGGRGRRGNHWDTEGVSLR